MFDLATSRVEIEQPRVNCSRGSEVKGQGDRFDKGNSTLHVEEGEIGGEVAGRTLTELTFRTLVVAV